MKPGGELLNTKKLEKKLSSYEFLGKGNSGRVYRMKNGKVLKIFYSEKICKREYEILKTTNGSPHFPKVYKCHKNYMIREYVGGINGYKYLSRYGITKSFVIGITTLIDEMKAYRFTKLCIKLQHLYVQKNGKIMLIDPRSSFTKKVPYPERFLQSLKRRGNLKKFMKILKKVRPDYYTEWKKAR